jgi:hypothetical protein
VDVKVGIDLILANTRDSRVRGYCICQKSKTVFRNVANITREYIRNFSEFIRNFELMLPPIVEWNCLLHVSQKERKLIYTMSIPVSDARRDGLRAAEEDTAALLEKAGLAGAKILCLLMRLGVPVDFEELPPSPLALSNSVIKVSITKLQI